MQQHRQLIAGAVTGVDQQSFRRRQHIRLPAIRHHPVADALEVAVAPADGVRKSALTTPAGRLTCLHLSTST